MALPTSQALTPARLWFMVCQQVWSLHSIPLPLAAALAAASAAGIPFQLLTAVHTPPQYVPLSAGEQKRAHSDDP